MMQKFEFAEKFIKIWKYCSDFISKLELNGKVQVKLFSKSYYGFINYFTDDNERVTSTILCN